MDTLKQDLGFAARALRKHPGFALTAILTLALGIGASTAIFSVVNAVLLRSLPYKDADRLVFVWGDMRNRKVYDFPFPAGDYKDLKEQANLFEDFAAVNPFRVALSGDGAEPEQVKVAGVTYNLIEMLGARMQVGRAFVADDATPQPPPPPRDPNAPANAQPPAPPQLPPMVILNYGFWQRRYGGDASIVGKSIDVGGGRAQVVGVLAPGFEILFPPSANIDAVPDMLFAQRINFDDPLRINVFLRVIGKLKPGVPLARAQDQVEKLAATLREQYPIKKTADLHFRLERMHDDLVADVRPAIVALMGAVIFVLLIACANVANLLLVRASARERELAVRAALGSSPWRLVRQLLAESVMISLLAAMLGLALAYGGIKLLTVLAPSNLPRLDTVRIDPIVLAFTVVASLLSAVLFGLVPAVRASRPDLADVLRQGGRSPGLSGAKLLRNAVVAVEVALSFVLLIGCGLMVRSFAALQKSDPGYDPNGVLTFVVNNPRLQSDGERAAFQRTMRERLSALPGVQSVTATTPLMLDGQIINSRWGPPEAASDATKFQQANAHVVLPGYFATMKAKLVAGRVFDETDNRPEVLNIVIDEPLAVKAFPKSTPRDVIGKQLLVRFRGNQPEMLTVIGIVGHERHESLVTPGREAIFFMDGFLGHGFSGSWVVRTVGEPTRLAASVRQTVASIDSRLPVAQLQPMSALVSDAMAPTRFALIMISIFAVIAAVLAAVGLYGVLSTVVRQRTAEIGVRMAFGATNRSIFGLVIGQGLKLSAIGIVAGVVAAVLLTRIMASLLVGVKATDPLTFGVMAVVFALIATLAAYLPARRAARLDPTVALREE